MASRIWSRLRALRWAIGELSKGELGRAEYSVPLPAGPAGSRDSARHRNASPRRRGLAFKATLPAPPKNLKSPRMLATWTAVLAGVAAAIAAAVMLFHRSLYVCAVCLLVILFQIAVFFFLAGATTLAFLQTMIYAGAVMVLILIVIMASPRPQAEVWTQPPLPRPLAVGVLLLPLAETFLLIRRAALPEGGLGLAWPAQAKLGAVLFKDYAAATEAVTLLMFLAGLAIIGRRPERT